MSSVFPTISAIPCNVNNVAEIVQTKIFPFTVEKFRLSGPDNMRSPFYGLYNSAGYAIYDGGACHSVSVKSGYNPHTADDMAACAEAGMKAFGTEFNCLITGHYSNRGHELIIAPSKEFRKSIYGTKDNIFPRMKIGGYFGRPFIFEMGMYRDACSNLMIARSVQESTVIIRHTNGLRSKMAELIQTLESVNGAWEQIGQIAAMMESKRVAIADFLAQLYPVPETDSKKAVTQARNRTEKILSRLLAERMKTERPDNFQTETEKTATLWELLNAVTGYVQHDKTRHTLDNGSEMGMVERALVAIDDSETVNAWDMALAMMAS